MISKRSRRIVTRMGRSPASVNVSPPVLPIAHTGTFTALARASTAAALCRRHRDEIARLILAEPVGVGRNIRRRSIEPGPDPGGHRHFGERNQKAAVGKVVRRRRGAVEDQRADEIAVLALLGEIDRRRRALLAAADLAQIHRLAEPARRLADQQ